MNTFTRELSVQRWDDHRYYHQSRINQTLHLVSALSFVCAYVLLPINPAAAGILGWCVSMLTRQAGHFFFEPRGYDEVNQATDEYKEAVKVGYNIRRKIVLMGVWALLPVLLWVQPSMLGLIEPARDFGGYVHDVGIAWLALGAGGLAFRALQLTLTRGPLSALAWVSKIVTDPFHDIALYYKAPLALLRGELLDPMHHVNHR